METFGSQIRDFGTFGIPGPGFPGNPDPPAFYLSSKLDPRGVPTGFAKSANQASLTEGGFFLDNQTNQEMLVNTEHKTL